MSPPALQSIGTRRPPPQRAVVVGASGMVGRSWCGLLTAHGIPYRALARPEIDLSKPEQLAEEIGPEDRLVVNAAAWTNVDAAESDEAGATLANADAVQVLADRCSSLGCPLIHYSTDYVFSGNGSSPYPVGGHDRAGQRVRTLQGCRRDRAA